MNFTCEKNDLLNAITTTANAVASKSNIQALEGILVHATYEGVYMTGYNLNTGIRTALDASCSEAGKVIIPARLFAEIVRKMPNETVSVFSEMNQVKITCGDSKFNITGIDAKDYPDLPEVEETQTQFSITQGALKDMISRTVFAVATSDARPIHTGALFEVDGDSLTMVALDGYRMALRKEIISYNSAPGGTMTFVVPGYSLNEVPKICTSMDDMIDISVGEHHILFQVGSTTLVSRLLDGKFLEYKNTLPKDSAVSIQIETKKIRDSLERVSLVINEKLRNPIRCKFEDGYVELSSITNVGSAHDTCPMDGNGNGLEIGFNNRFMLDAIRHVPTETVKMEMNTAANPCIIKSVDDDSFLFMVLPVRLKAQ